MSEETLTRTRLATLMAQVYDLVRACPAGRVTTYGALAKTIGYPRGARVVGWFMNDIPDHTDIPAQRVLNATGELTGSWAFGQRGKMRQLLEAEGIPFSPEERVDMKHFGWEPMRDLSDDERVRILAAATPDAITISSRLLYNLLNDKASPFRGLAYTE